MSNKEKQWALKSSNLKRIKSSGRKDSLNKTISRNYRTNNFENPIPSHPYENIRKSNFPILPSPPFFKRTGTTEKWENDSNNTSDYGSDISSKRSSKYKVSTIPSVIDNKFYRKYLSNRQLERSHSQNNNGIVNNRNIKQYVVPNPQTPLFHTSKNRINLNIFHAIQMVSFEIIDETLDDELVPDILIDVFQNFNYKKEKFRRQIIPIVRSTAEQIMIEVIDQYIHETVLLIILRDSKNQLHSKIIFKWILDDLLLSSIIDVSKLAIRDVAIEKLAIRKSDQVFEKLVTDFINEDIIKSERVFYNEVIAELFIDDYIIDPVIEETLTSISNEMITHYHEKVSRINLQEVSEMAVGKPFGELIIDHLISVGIRQKMVYGPSFAAQYCFEHLTMDILLDKTYEIYEKLMNTTDNQSFRNLHKTINQTIVSEVLLKELLEHVDADLCDLDAEEVQEFHIPRYLNIDQTFFGQSK